MRARSHAAWPVLTHTHFLPIFDTLSPARPWISKYGTNFHAFSLLAPPPPSSCLPTTRLRLAGVGMGMDTAVPQLRAALEELGTTMAIKRGHGSAP